MKTSKEELERRRLEFEEDLEEYKKWSAKIKAEKDPIKRDKLLEDENFRKINQKFSLGPTYIIWKEDYEDPDYRLSWGSHPSEHEPLKRFYDEGYYDSLVEMCFWNNPPIVKHCVAMAYDYADFYYVCEEIDKPGEYFYETMVSPVKIHKEDGKID